VERIIVTGCAGFIGGHLSSHLLEHGYEVVGIDNLSTSGPVVIDELRAKGLIFFQEDIRDAQRMKEIFLDVQPSCVFHHAAYAFVEQSFKDPENVMSINVTGTKIMAELSAKVVASLVYASSSAVYVNRASPLKTTDPTSPTSPYAESKLLSEKVVSEVPDLLSIGLRYFNVYGPHQSTAYGSVIPAWFSAAKNQRPLEIYGSGDISRDFTYV